MPKFFVDKSEIIQNSVTITGGDAVHIGKVLRLTKGDKITLCDGEGTDFSAEICDILKDSVTLNIKKSMPCEAEPSISVTLFQALPKQGKMDFIIEKCTELGISRIVPVKTHRCVMAVRDEKAEEKKLSRWRKIAAEAVKQCGRGVIPEVTEVMTLSAAIEMAKTLDLPLAAYENERVLSLKECLLGKSPKTVGIFIGPEGGFEESEIENLMQNNIPAVTLGKRILRTETAGQAVLTAVMYAFDELG